MKKTLSVFIIISSILFSLCCGKRGPIYPPLVKIPKPIEEFHAFQRGTHIILSWNNPVAYIDGNPVEEITRVDIWLLIAIDEVAKDKELAPKEVDEKGQEESPEADQEAGDKDKGESMANVVISTAESFPENAKFVASIAKELFSDYQNQTQEQSLVGDFVCIHPISSGDFAGKKYTFGLKVWAKKKESDFSELLSIKPKALPHPPTGLKTEVLEDQIQIAWTPPEKNIDDSAPAEVKGYMVYRRSEDKEMRRVSTVLITDTKFSDSEFQFDEKYTYYVRTLANESEPLLESNNSEPLEIIPKDTFPPIIPKGLVAIPGEDYVSLSWNPNREPDLAGYRIWRISDDDKDYTVLGELIRENVYNDTTVNRDKRYEYAITAVDKSGNESQKSKSISVILGRGLT